MLDLVSGPARLRLAPALGGSIADWWLGDVPVMRPSAPDAASAREMASYPLVPISNRVAQNRFSFAGLTHHLAPLLNGQAIHGAGWMLPWRVADRGPAHAVLALDYPGGELWPFAFHAEQRFVLAADGLRHDIMVRNDADHPAPCAIGMHPFFPRTPGTRLRFAARHVWLQDAQRIPTERIDTPSHWDHRSGLPVGVAVLDHCFASWGGVARIDWPEHGLSATIAADPVFRHVILFVPEGRDFFAFEPVANMTDGVNRIDDTTDHGMAVLKPGEALAGTIRITLETT